MHFLLSKKKSFSLVHYHSLSNPGSLVLLWINIHILQCAFELNYFYHDSFVNIAQIQSSLIPFVPQLFYKLIEKKESVFFRFKKTGNENYSLRLDMIYILYENFKSIKCILSGWVTWLTVAIQLNEKKRSHRFNENDDNNKQRNAKPSLLWWSKVNNISTVIGNGIVTTPYIKLFNGKWF